MLTAETKVLCGTEVHYIKDVREESQVSGAAGWSEIGRSKVTDIFAQFDYQGSLITLTTSRGATLTCSPDQTCFGRMNPISRHYQIYLMERSTMGFRVGMSQELMRDLFTIQQTKNDFTDSGDIIDKVWILEATESLPRAVFLEKLVTFKYGIPNLPFSGKQAIAELSDEMIREIFNRIDTPKRGRELLKDSLMFEEFPHITMRIAKAGPQNTNAVQFILFGGSEKRADKAGYAHLIRIDGTVQLNRIEQKQFKRRMSNHGLWHLEVTRDDLEEAQLFVRTISCLDNLQVIQKIQLTKKAPFYILPASHVKVGMAVPIMGVKGIEEDIVTAISVKEYEGPLYHLKTDGLFNFIAGEWIVSAFNAFSQNAPKPGEQP